jgi:hypothetical protein
VKTVVTVLMLLVFTLAVACGGTTATVTTEGQSPTTVMGIQTGPSIPHNIPYN